MRPVLPHHCKIIVSEYSRQHHIINTTRIMICTADNIIVFCSSSHHPARSVLSLTMSPKKKAKTEIAANADIVQYDNTAYMKVVNDNRNFVLSKYPELKPDQLKFDSGPMLSSYATDEEFELVGFVSVFSMESQVENMPLIEAKMMRYKSHFFSGKRPDKSIAGKLLGVVDKDTTKAELNTLLKNGAVPFAMPIEILHAWWTGFAEAIRNKHKDQKAWVDACKEHSIKFQHLIEDAAEMKDFQEREDVVEAAANLRVTPLMRIIHIGNVKARLEKASLKIASAKQVKEYYLEKLTPSASESEAITDGLVDQSCTINNRMLSLPEVRSMLLNAEELPPKTNPLEGTSRLQNLIQKARTPARITIAVEMILDHRKGGLLPNQPPVRRLLAPHQDQEVKAL